jgi:serine/threonine protein kinase
VYSGTWKGRESAIKVLDWASKQGAKEFLREVNILGNYQHPNLLPLLGFCISKEEDRHFCALIYPRMKRSLQDALAQSRRRNGGQGGGQALSATDRLMIARDVATGLAYLHSSDSKCVILHRDMKSSNILLNAENRARIADVGLARIMEAGSSQTAGVGTFEYMDRSYFETGRYTPGSDVFSLGVVLLELLTGEAAIDSRKDPAMLHARVTSCVSQAGSIASLADPKAGWLPSVAEHFGSVAVGCVSYTAMNRPSSQEVAERLSLMAEHPRVQPAESDKECLMCMDATRRTRMRPCCHVLFCEECANEALRRGLKCPMCSVDVDDYEVGDFNATYVPA